MIYYYIMLVLFFCAVHRDYTIWVTSLNCFLCGDKYALIIEVVAFLLFVDFGFRRSSTAGSKLRCSFLVSVVPIICVLVMVFSLSA